MVQNEPEKKIRHIAIIMDGNKRWAKKHIFPPSKDIVKERKPSRKS